MLLRAGHFEFRFPRPALVMGIINVTPDSFSDGGQFFDPREAVNHAIKLVEEGAGIIDVGGESTRPWATPVPLEEELRRVLPVVEELVRRLEVPISIDTMKPEVARAALQAGATIINDVAANREEEALWRVAAEGGAGYVCVHMQGTPATMQQNPIYSDVEQEVAAFFLERIKRLNGCGVTPEQIILDPGIGFGKTVDQNLLLLGALRSFTELGRPLLLGVSRKSFIGRVLGGEMPSRLAGALAISSLAVEAGAQIIRAHDVAQTVQAVRMTEAIMAKRNK